MSYKALYRKYRPDDLSQVVGQKNIVVTLNNVVNSTKIAHAYLFAGPKGTGKTSVALAFAKTLNCTNKKGNNAPCSSCKQCLSAKNSLDIIEIDAASNNGVDEIRNLIDNVKYAPSISEYKVYIIDEVHMLSKGAFNALLKTLEEPPRYVIFILATTEVHKVPATILSRTQRFNFSNVETSVIKKHIQNIADKEGFEYDAKGVDLLSKLANGSVRDGLSILDQVAAYSKGKIYFEAIAQVFGVTSLENQIKILNLMFLNESGECLKTVNTWMNNGIDISRLVEAFVEILGDYIVFCQTKDFDLLSCITKLDVQNLQISKAFAYFGLDLFVELLNKLKNSSFPKQVFEIAILKLLDFGGSDANKVQKVANNKALDANDEQSATSLEEELEQEFEKEFGKNQPLQTKSNEKDLFDTQVTSLNYEEREEENLPNNTVSQKEQQRNLGDTPVEEESKHVNRSSTPNWRLEENQEKSLKSGGENNGNFGKDEENVNYNLGDPDTNTGGAKVKNQNNEEGNEEETIDIFDLLEIEDETQDLNLEEAQNESPRGELNHEEIINILMQSNQNYLLQAKKKMGLLSNYKDNIKYGNFLTIMEQIKLIAAGDGFILCSSEKESVVYALDSFASEPSFVQFTHEVFGQPQKVFTITKEVFLKIKEKWTELKNSNSLPEVKKIGKIEVNEGKEKDEIEEFGKKVFGNSFER